MTSTNHLSIRLVSIDIVVFLALSTLALSPLMLVFVDARWVISAAGGLGLSIAVTLLAIWQRWGLWLSALSLVVSYLLFAPALAIPGGTMAGVVPTLEGIRASFTGVVSSWRNALTMQLPLSNEHEVLIAPLLIALIAGVFTLNFLWRSKWPSLAGFGIVAMFVAAASFGSATPDFALMRGLVLVAALLVWLRWRAQRHVRTSWFRRFALTAGVISVAGLLGGGLTAATITADRQVLRDHVDPPMQKIDFKSPLSNYRSYYKNHKKDTLFEISGLPKDAQVRLAVMDEFDGLVWNVTTIRDAKESSAFLNAPAATSSDAVRVTIREDYAGPWVPTLGATSGVSLTEENERHAARQLLFNRETGSVAQLGGVRSGDVYAVDWNFTPQADFNSEEQVDRAVVIAKPQLWAQLDKMVQTWLAESGAGSDLEIIQTIEKQLKNGYYSNGLAADPFPVASGHGAKRLADLVADPHQMIGNDEQYASLMALILQSQGMPARVVLGFEPAAGPKYTGDDIAAWVEVKFLDSGWRAFDPTPDEDRRPTALSEDPNPLPQPNVVQPPVVPNEPEQAMTSPPEGAGKSTLEDIWAFLKLILGYLLLLAKWLLYLSPFWSILLFKAMRRRRRRNASDPVTQTSGGWREVIDRARDLGIKLPPSQTRYEHGKVLASCYPDAELGSLATVADRHVFGPTEPSEAEVAAYWDDVESALVRMRKAAPWWRRLVQWISPASIPWTQLRASATSFTQTTGQRVRGTRVGQSLERRMHRLRAALKNRANRKKVTPS